METLEEAAEGFYEENAPNITFLMMAQFGAEFQAERMYSKEDIIDFVYFLNDRHFNRYTVDTDEVDLFIEQFKKK